MSPAAAYDQVADVVDAVIGILETSTALTMLAGGRVMGGELDADEIAHQPRSAVVVAYSPGGSGQSAPGSRDVTPITVARVDVLAYGETPRQAGLLSGALHQALKHWGSDSSTRVVAHVLVHWCDIIAGPTPYRDARGACVCVRTYDVQHADALVT